MLALNDILRTARALCSGTHHHALPAAAAFYLIMTLVLTWFFQHLEKRYAKYDQ